MIYQINEASLIESNNEHFDKGKSDFILFHFMLFVTGSNYIILPFKFAYANLLSLEELRGLWVYSCLIDDAINGALESVEPADIDSAVDADLDSVMAELTAIVLAPAGHAPMWLKKAAAISVVVSSSSCAMLSTDKFIRRGITKNVHWL